MTITLLAPDGVPVTAQQERQARAAGHGGGWARPLGGRSGFRVDTPADTLTATNTTWTLKPCSAMLDPGFSTHQGMYGWSSDANITGAVTAADVNNSRKDIVYIQVDDSSAGDGSGAVAANVKYLAGNPALVPDPPALPARSFLVGTLTVPKAGGGAPTVVLNRQWYVAAGGVLPVTGVPDRPVTPYIGQQICRLDRDGMIQTYTGASGSGWQYLGAPKRYTMDASGFDTTSDQNNKLIATMTAHGTKPYSTRMRVCGRATVFCQPYASGVVQIKVNVSVNVTQATAAQQKARVSWLSPGGYYQTAQAETDWVLVAANQTGTPRLWIEHVQGAVNENATAVASDGHLWVEVIPADD